MKFLKIHQNGPLDKIYGILFIHCSTSVCSNVWKMFIQFNLLDSQLHKLNHLNVHIAALHLLTNPRTAIQEFFRNGPRHRVSNKNDEDYNYYCLAVMILGSSNQAIGCVHHQCNTVSHYILLINVSPILLASFCSIVVTITHSITNGAQFW